MKTWNWIDDANFQHLGVLEVESGGYFEVMETPTHLVFGGFTNNSFLQSGYIEREEFESLNETLFELKEELDVFYRDGRDYCSRIVCNERM